MPTTFLTYSLSQNYIHNWLVAGPQIFQTESENVADTFRTFYQADSGVTETPVDLGPLTLADSALTWRYLACREDHLVDFSAVQVRPCYARAWACAQINLPGPQAVHLTLTTNGPADVWLNGQHLHRHEHFDRQRPHSATFPASLPAGRNEILIRFESAGVGALAHVMALAIQPPTEITLTLPTEIEPERLEKRRALEQIVEQASLDRYVYGYMDGDHYDRNEPIPLRFSADTVGSGEITARLQSLSGDIYQEATKVFAANTTLELAKTFPLQNGPHHLALQPIAHEYYQQRLRFERQELFYIVRTPYTHKASLNAKERVHEALDDAAQRRRAGLYGEIAKMLLRRWDKVNPKVIEQTLENVNQRGVGAATAVLGLLGITLRFEKKKLHLDPALQQALETSLANYRYGPVETDSESVELLSAVDEILVGQLWPNRILATTEQTGRWHKRQGEARALAWLRQKGQSGFRQWASASELEIIVAALAHVVDLASSAAVREAASALMDKIFFGLAVGSFKGAYGSSKGEATTASVLSARLEPTSGLSRLLWGQGNLNEHVIGTVSVAGCRKYQLPDLIRRIALHPVEAFWGQERQAWPDGDVNTVTYQTQDFMLASAQDYRPGQAGKQEHIWQATLGPDAIAYVNHPTCLSEADAHQPNLWRGNGVLPRVAQWGDVLLAVYALPPEDWLGFTHAYFPTAAFDEYRFTGQWAFARKGTGYLALRATQGLTFITHGPTAYRELRSVGQENLWLCHMGQSLLDGDFENFQRKILAMEVNVDGLSMRLKSLRGDELAFGWEGPLWLNGAEQPLSGFRHMENSYCVADLPASQMDIVYQQEGLRLKFE